jgi:hypothetical protein
MVEISKPQAYSPDIVGPVAALEEMQARISEPSAADRAPKHTFLLSV